MAFSQALMDEQKRVERVRADGRYQCTAVVRMGHYTFRIRWGPLRPCSVVNPGESTAAPRAL